MSPIRRWSVLVVVLVAAWGRAADQPAPIPAGTGSTTVTLGATELKVFTYKPDGYDPRTSTLLLVFHGTNRNADEYRDFAKPLGDKLKALVAAPLFPNNTFPNDLYQFGGLRVRGEMQPKEKWTWSLIPKIAADLRRREGRPDMPFDLIGHSAGGQFLSRMSGFVSTGARRVVAANPGSHLFPTRDQPFPYGFGGLPDELSNDDALRRHLAQPLTIYLGTGDVIQDANFPRGAEAMKQGDSRYQRGKNAFKAGQ
jgi:poly(3-hydroxybutyrate) depolymerase